MFTGIVAAMGEVAACERRGATGRLRVAAPAAFLRGLEPGDSIAVSGCCLTAARLAPGPAAGRASFTADLAPETLRRTRFGRLRQGEALNLELPLRAGQPLGGHIVQGHVDGVGILVRPRRHKRQPDAGRLAVRLPVELSPYVAPQGSLAVEGVSLTVASLEEDQAEFAIIPFTRAHTNLGRLRPGAAVNIEVDLWARYVARFTGMEDGRAEGRDVKGAGMRTRGAGAWIGELRRQGF